MPNYDTTNGRPYTRVSRIAFDIGEDGMPKNVEYHKRLAVVSGGQVHHLADTPTIERLDITTITEPVSIPDPATGQMTAETTTVAQVSKGLFAIIRADMINKDTAQALAEQAAADAEAARVAAEAAEAESAAMGGEPSP